MSTIRRFRTATLGIAAVCSVVLVGPVRAHETDHALTLAPVSALDRQVVAAQQALRAGDLGSMQEEALLSVVTASTSWERTHGDDAVTARRVLTAQHALESADLGSMQEEALSAMVAAVSTEDEAEVDREALIDALRG
jgi:UDP-N-acetylglucosamine 2-epimerase